MSRDPWNPEWDGPRAIVLWTYWHPTHRTKAQRRNDARRGKTLSQNRSQRATGTVPIE